METNHYVVNINEIKKLAMEIKALDLFDPSSRTVTVMSEIIDLCKKLPDLEIVDFTSNDLNIDNIEADA